MFYYKCVVVYGNFMTINPVSSVNNNIKNLSFGENKENTVAENKSRMTTQTKVLLGTTLAALAATGIYIATRGKVKVKTNNKPLADIIEEGLSTNGDKFKIIKDSNNGNWKEQILYFDNGNVKFHNYYDSSINDINKSVTKEITYYENGDVYSITSYAAPGKKSKYIHYNSSDDVEKYGFNIIEGTKYHNNGKMRFKMVHCPGMSDGLACSYDINGNLISERIIKTPKYIKN